MSDIIKQAKDILQGYLQNVNVEKTAWEFIRDPKLEIGIRSIYCKRCAETVLHGNLHENPQARIEIVRDDEFYEDTSYYCPICKSQGIFTLFDFHLSLDRNIFKENFDDIDLEIAPILLKKLQLTSNEVFSEDEKRNLAKRVIEVDSAISLRRELEAIFDLLSQAKYTLEVSWEGDVVLCPPKDNISGIRYKIPTYHVMNVETDVDRWCPRRMLKD